MTSAQKIGFFGLIASSALASTALGIVPWSNPTGSTVLFSWSNGYTNNGLFGDPAITTNTFNFTPPAFFAGGTHAATATDTITVTLAVNPGQLVTAVRIHEWGTRTTGTTAVTGTLFVKDLQLGGFGQLQQSVSITNGTPVGGVMSWDGTALITGLNFTAGQQLSVQLTDNLMALTGQQTQKFGATVEILPTPGVLGLAGAAGLVALRRRRR